MTKFQITVLGCGSAMPTTLHYPSSQLVDVNEKLFMIDCGEGAQLQLRKFKMRMSKLHSIFISHLHGDHVFGLPGLISTLNLLGRTADLNIYAHKNIDVLLNPTLAFFNPHLSFRVNVFTLSETGFEQIYENKSIRVSSFPLKHRMPTSGFLVEEKEKPRHIRRDMIDFHQIPIKKIREIKDGADYVKPDGIVVPNYILTYPSAAPRRYAYCSDTAYSADIIPYISGVDVLYHEATFAESELKRAHDTFHSTAREAAEIAREAQVKKLVIGHYSSRYQDLDSLLQQARNVFPNTELAKEGMEIVV